MSDEMAVDPKLKQAAEEMRIDEKIASLVAGNDLRPYSTSINAAMDALHRMDNFKIEGWICNDEVYRYCVSLLKNFSWSVVGRDDSLPMAICKAILIYYNRDI